jgi:hypothetical protein
LGDASQSALTNGTRYDIIHNVNSFPYRLSLIMTKYGSIFGQQYEKSAAKTALFMF